MDLVSESFDDQDAQAILATPLSERIPSNNISLSFTKDGSCPVKTAYMVGD